MNEKPRVKFTFVPGEKLVGVQIITGFWTISWFGSLSFDQAIAFMNRVNALELEKGNSDSAKLWKLAAEYGLRPPLR